MRQSNRILKAAIIERYGTQKNFLLSLNDGPNGIRINENRLTRIITGRTSTTAEERRAFAWKLQRPMSDLFPEIAEGR
jgi:hypothetical protein